MPEWGAGLSGPWRRRPSNREGGQQEPPEGSSGGCSATLRPVGEQPVFLLFLESGLFASDGMSLDCDPQSDPAVEKVQQEVGASMLLFVSSQSPSWCIVESHSQDWSGVGNLSVSENTDTSGHTHGPNQAPKSSSARH